MKTVLTRETTQRIVHDLARATRTPKAIASRYDVPLATVEMLRDHYGPEIPKLIDAAEQLRRPVRTLPKDAELVDVEPEPVVAAVVEPAEPGRPKGDGLTSENRAAARAWAIADGRDVATRGKLPQAIVDAWVEAGRPDATEPDPLDADDPDAPDPVDYLSPSGETLAGWAEEYAHATDERVAELVQLPEIVECPTGERLMALARQACTDVLDVLPYAIEYTPELVWDWVTASSTLTEAVGVDRIERARINAAAQVLYELSLQGLLGDNREAFEYAARLALAAAEGA